MARIPTTVCLFLGLCFSLLILTACESRQNTEKKTTETTSWRAAPKVNVEPEVTPPSHTEKKTPVEPQTPPEKGKPETPPQKTKPETPAQKTKPQPTQTEPKPTQPVEQPEPKKTEKPKPLTPPETMPKVELSKNQAATCLVKARDAFPEGQLPDLAGKPQNLADLYGKRLTVVFLWSNGKTDYTRSAMDVALGDLQLDFQDKYQKDDLRVVGINVGGTPEGAKPQIEKSGVKFPVLLDPKEDFLHKVASATKEIPQVDLPRVYLLDAAGHVLWFDIDFTYISRHDLKEAIEIVLKQKP
jgi:peroxiredoxin